MGVQKEWKDDLLKFSAKASREDVKAGIDLIKFLHKNEYNQDLKRKMAYLGNTLTKLLR